MFKILVLGVLRLGLNADYDRIQELANQHRTIRQFLGHGDGYDEERYGLQRLRDNLRLFTLEILLHHQVAQQRTDEKVAIAITRETKARYMPGVAGKRPM